MNLNEKILDLLKETAYRFFELQKEVANKLNIKKNYYKILIKLGIEKKAINQTCLGELCSIDKPATSRLVADMEKDGLILKNLKNGSKKEFMISLSEKGEKTLERISSLMDELKPKYFNEPAEKEKKEFITIFENLLSKENDNA
jgi:DNA-binding MarR family transcriptional regulator